MTDKSSFILYYSYYDQIALLSKEERGSLLTAIYEFEVLGEVREPLTPLTKMAFSFIQGALIRDRAAYEERCARGRENGKRGGRPPKEAPLTADGEDPDQPKKTKGFSEKPKKTLGFSEKPKKPDTGTDTGTGTDTDTDTGTGTDTGTDTDTDTDTVSVAVFGAEQERDCGAVPKEGGIACGRSAPVSAAPPPSSEGRSAPVSAAPPPSSEERSAPNEKEFKKRGIPLDYVSKRWERAARYAASVGKSAEQVMEDWWQRDGGTARKAHSPPVPPRQSEYRSYDVDDFFQAALERSLSLLEEDSAKPI